MIYISEFYTYKLTSDFCHYITDRDTERRFDTGVTTPTIDLDITAVTLADGNAVCDVASLISEDTVISGTSADDTSTCLSTHEEVDDGICDSSDDVMSDDETAIPDNQPPSWNRMMEDMSAEISDMTAKLCVIPKPEAKNISVTTDRYRI